MPERRELYFKDHELELEATQDIWGEAPLVTLTLLDDSTSQKVSYFLNDEELFNLRAFISQVLGSDQ